MVFWCSLGENIGDEENGKGDNFRRPVLILKKFNQNLFWGVPLSSKLKDNKYYIKVSLNKEAQSVMVPQLRILYSRRLAQFVGYVKKSDFVNVKNTIKSILD